MMFHPRLTFGSLIALAAFGVAAAPATLNAQSTQAGASARSAPLSRPTGWLGIHYSAEAKIDETGEGFRISYNSYPVIEAIEPGSPAEKSGLQVGDTLIAFNGYDFVRRGVPMSRLLRPGEKLSIVVKRGTRRTTKVTVGERPAGLFGYAMITPRLPAGTRVIVERPLRPDGREIRRSVAELREAATTMAPHTAAVAEDAARRTVRMLEREIVMNPSVAPLIAFSAPSGGMNIAGADMVPINPQLGETLGVPRGVLILNVPGGTPAEQSGLRAGDIIVKAANAEIVNAAGLHMAMLHAGPAQAVTLDVVRKRKLQRVVLRW